MTHSTIITAFYLALFVIFPIGILLMILWGKRIYPGFRKNIEKKKKISLDEVGLKGTIYMMPGIIACAIFATPAVYLNYLLKQEIYCIEIIKVNHLKKDDSFLKERCGILNIDELFEKSAMDDEK